MKKHWAFMNFQNLHHNLRNFDSVDSANGSNDLMISERRNKMKQIIINIILLTSIVLVIGMLSIYVSYAATAKEMNTNFNSMNVIEKVEISKVVLWSATNAVNVL